MKEIIILALDNALASSVMGTMDILCQAGQSYNHIAGKKPVTYFDVKVATEDGLPVKGFNNVDIIPHCGTTDIDHTDVVVVSSFMDFNTLESNKGLLNWLVDLHEKGTVIASICVGSFFIAQTGLLDGKTATTHWGFKQTFSRWYPKVNLMPDRLITDEGSIVCSGACNSYIDLSAHLISRFCGRTAAIESSKTMIHDFARSSQAPYELLQTRKSHSDQTIRKIQERIEQQPEKPFHPETLAVDFGMSRRTFERRFKLCTGDTPVAYLHRVRVENAKHRLETSHLTFDEIAYTAGYEDAGFFRKIFKKYTGLLPGEYRMKFQR